MNEFVAIAVIAFFPLGLKFASGEGMILASFGRLMEPVKKWSHWIRKGLWTCERCMCLLWGIPAACAVLFLPLWASWPVLLVTAVGVQLLVQPE